MRKCHVYPLFLVVSFPLVSLFDSFSAHLAGLYSNYLPFTATGAMPGPPARVATTSLPAGIPRPTLPTLKRSMSDWTY
jgi:hypothetical protein